MSDPSTILASLPVLVLGLWFAWSGGKNMLSAGRIHFDRTQHGMMTRGNVIEISAEGAPTISYVRGADAISSFTADDSYFTADDSYFTADQVGERVRIWYDDHTGEGPVVLADDFLYFWLGAAFLLAGLVAAGMGLFAIFAPR